MSCYHSMKDGEGKTNRIHDDDDEEEEKIMIEKTLQKIITSYKKINNFMVNFEVKPPPNAETIPFRSTKAVV